MSGSEDHPRKPRQCNDPMSEIRGHVQDEPPKYAIGEAFTEACEALKGDTLTLPVFCEQLTRVVCQETTIDKAHTVVVDAWKERAG